jgi:hypothetical protein
MRKMFLLIALTITGCASTNSPPVVSSPIHSETPIPSPMATVSATALLKPSVPIATLTETKTAPLNPTQTPALMTLQIKSPQDESIVTVNKIAIIGTTKPNSVVSVNGALAKLDRTGRFEFTVTLEEGANSIEVIASDVDGNSVFEILNLIYEP